jgi:hypothetical protein
MRERHAVRTVHIDGEPVTLLIDRLTVDEFNRAAAFPYPRGQGVKSASADDADHLDRVAAIDHYIEPAPGEILIDGRPARRLGPLFGARAEIIARLYHALLAAQEPSAEERHDLSIAARFSEYLDDARRRNIPSDWVTTGTDCGKCHKEKLCAKRHCNGTPAKKVVWHDKKHQLKTCPVLSFTPETERVVRLFAWTHQLFFEGPGVLRYQRTGLPAGSALGDQEAWTMTALAYARDDYNELLAEHAMAERQRERDRV